MSNCYVYAHATTDGEVFYVGKGSGKRMRVTGNRSVFWKRVAAKHGWNAVLLEEGLTEEAAFVKEIEWIAYYKKIGQARVNLTDGGDGVKVPFRWWNEAISKALTGLVRKRGKDSPRYKSVATEEELRRYYVDLGLSSTEISKLCGVSIPTVIERLRSFGVEVREAGRKKKPVVCVTDGLQFESVADAAKFYNVFRENIRKVLNGSYKHTGGKVFAYVSVNSVPCGSNEQGSGCNRGSD